MQVAIKRITMKKIFLFTFILILASLILKAQILDFPAYEKNSAKYWLYRERLKTYFITQIGPGFGESLPASERQYRTNVMKWGDGTIYLAQYIAVLASEIKLLELSGNDYSKTTRELFFAMYAFNRLDLIAESTFGGSITSLNGFFIRDDAQPKFPNTTLLAKLNQGIIDNKRKVEKFESDFLNNVSSTDKEMSIDQCYWMFMAMHMVKECVPPGLFYVVANPTNGQPIPMQFQDYTYGFVASIFATYMNDKADTI